MVDILRVYVFLFYVTLYNGTYSEFKITFKLYIL